MRPMRFLFLVFVEGGVFWGEFFSPSSFFLCLQFLFGMFFRVYDPHHSTVPSSEPWSDEECRHDFLAPWRGSYGRAPSMTVPTKPTKKVNGLPHTYPHGRGILETRRRYGSRRASKVSLYYPHLVDTLPHTLASRDVRRRSSPARSCRMPNGSDHEPDKKGSVIEKICVMINGGVIDEGSLPLSIKDKKIKDTFFYYTTFFHDTTFFHVTAFFSQVNPHRLLSINGPLRVGAQQLRAIALAATRPTMGAQKLRANVHCGHAEASCPPAHMLA